MRSIRKEDFGAPPRRKGEAGAGTGSDRDSDGPWRSAVIEENPAMLRRTAMTKMRKKTGPVFASEVEFVVKRRKTAPHEFVLEALSGLTVRTRPMFGCVAVYAAGRGAGAEEKIVLVLRDKPGHAEDNGVWLATTVEHHESLRREFPNMRSIGVLGKKVTGWQILPVDAPDFEESALRACELIGRGDPRIGKVPGAKKRAGSKGKKAVRAGREAGG